MSRSDAEYEAAFGKTVLLIGLTMLAVLVSTCTNAVRFDALEAQIEELHR